MIPRTAYGPVKIEAQKISAQEACNYGQVQHFKGLISFCCFNNKLTIIDKDSVIFVPAKIWHIIIKVCPQSCLICYYSNIHLVVTNLEAF